MGLLDEAIREHLDLKRRHGADPAEIERAEREALGPARREPDEVEPEEADDLEFEVPEFGSVADPADEGLFDQETELTPTPRDRPVVGDEPVAGDSALDEPPASADEPSPSSSELPPTEHLAQETEEYDVELEDPPETEGEQGGREEMLEETPDFLQDTPEHDRLWFEQRPPRDFDFDD